MPAGFRLLLFMRVGEFTQPELAASPPPCKGEDTERKLRGWPFELPALSQVSASGMSWAAELLREGLCTWLAPTTWDDTAGGGGNTLNPVLALRYTGVSNRMSGRVTQCLNPVSLCCTLTQLQPLLVAPHHDSSSPL